MEGLGCSRADFTFFRERKMSAIIVTGRFVNCKPAVLTERWPTVSHHYDVIEVCQACGS